jgi:predicted ATPase/Tfp pilus assembly protein PilF
LGAGGMGVVYEAFDLLLERHVALKFLPERLGGDRAARDRMLHEARALAGLDHPNVGAVHDVEVADDGRPFLVLALHRGTTLAQRLVPVPWRDAIELAVSAARGLAHAHAAGVVHGDVKPANLLVTREGVLKLLDFGLAGVEVPGALEARGLGTLEYMAPEVLRGARPTPASDVWSLAVVVYELLTGVGPFRADGREAAAVVRRVIEDEPPRPSSIDASVPAAFDETLARALAKSTGARTPSAAAFTLDLERAADTAASATAVTLRSERRWQGVAPPATPLVGREEELGIVRTQLAASVGRGVLLHGLGGTGKSRLALEVALDEAERLGAGGAVAFVPLAAGLSPEEVPARVADALGLSSAAADGWRALAAGIGDARTLVVLDDLDGLGPALERLPALLDACPGLRIVATAGARVDLRRFRAVALAGLRVPPEGTATAATAESFEAVRLFVEVARRARPEFSLDAASTPAVVALCLHAGGLPLAIEVIAPLMRTMPPEALASALAEDLDVLALPTTDHRSTLGVALEQSWMHLDGEGRSLAARIAVYEGSFDWAAARGVADASVTALSRLVDASLLAFGPDGRYTMHPLTRRFAWRRLDPGSRSEIEARHGRHVLGRLASLAPALRGPDQGAALTEVARSLTDVEAAWRWAGRANEAELLGACADPLRLFYDRRGQVRHGADVLGVAGAVPEVAVHRAWLLMLTGDADAAEALASAALADLGDDVEAIHAATGWSALGAVAAGRGETSVAEGHFRRALELAEQRGDDALAARCLDNLASVAEGGGRADAARAFYERGLDLARRGGNEAQTAVTLNNLGTLHLHAGRRQEAAEALEEALSIARRFELEGSIPVVLANLAEVARAARRWDDGVAYAEEAARRAGRLGNVHIESAAWAELGASAAGRGDHEAARAALRRAVASAWGAGDGEATRHAVHVWADVETAAGRHEVARRWRAAIAEGAAADPEAVGAEAAEADTGVSLQGGTRSGTASVPGLAGIVIEMIGAAAGAVTASWPRRS